MFLQEQIKGIIITSLIGITTSPSVSVTFVSDVSRIRCTHFDLKRSLESCWLCSWSLSPSLLFSLHSSLGYLICELLRAPLLTGLRCNSVRNPLASVCSSLSSKIFIRLASFRSLPRALRACISDHSLCFSCPTLGLCTFAMGVRDFANPSQSVYILDTNLVVWARHPSVALPGASFVDYDQTSVASYGIDSSLTPCLTLGCVPETQASSLLLRSVRFPCTRHFLNPLFT